MAQIIFYLTTRILVIKLLFILDPCRGICGDTETEIMTKPSISSDGYFLIFITEENNLNAISLESENIMNTAFDDLAYGTCVAKSKHMQKLLLQQIGF